MAAGDFKGSGDRIVWTAGSTAITAGSVVVVRSGATGMIGVALTDIAATGTGVVQIEGEVELTKNTTTSTGVFTVGAIVYYDVADANVSTQASANIKVGIATEAAAAATTTVKVKLIPSKA